MFSRKFIRRHYYNEWFDDDPLPKRFDPLRWAFLLLIGCSIIYYLYHYFK